MDNYYFMIVFIMVLANYSMIARVVIKIIITMNLLC
jgi:hypothetical protein